MRALRNHTDPPPIVRPGTPPAGTWELRLRALTPIYKGGTNPRGIDPGRPFRGPSLRGQLRFWWRATSPLHAPAALWEAERRLFGGVFGEEVIASQVRVSVLDPQSSPSAAPQDAGYALWVHSTKWDDQNAFHGAGASAVLRVECPPAAAPEVHRALQAWLLFGGVGSRSRRGLGAVWAEGEGAPRLQSVEELVALARALGPSSEANATAAPGVQALPAPRPAPRSRPWPTLAGATLAVLPPERTPHAAWLKALGALQALRTATSPHRVTALGADFGAIAGGRSPVVSARAALGLPIQFRWQVEGRGWVDAVMGPQGHTQKKEKVDNRYPSPILLRPVPVGDRFCPLILVLSSPPPAALEIAVKGGPTLSGRSDPSGPRHLLGGLQRAGWTLYPLEVP